MNLDDFQYVTEGRYSIDAIRQCLVAIAETMEGVVPFSSGEEQFGGAQGLTKLPNLDGTAGVALTRLYIVGSAKSDAMTELVTSIESADDIIQHGASYSVTAHVQESQSPKQAAVRADRLVATTAAGRKALGYYAKGSKVARDPVYAADFFKKFADLASLSIFVRQEGDKYFLDAQGDIKLQTTMKGFAGDNPKGMRCDLPTGASADTLAEYFKHLVDTCAAKVFQYSWAMNIEGAETDAVLAAYKALRAAALPADTYDMTWALRLESLEGLDVLPHMLAPGGTVTTRVCSFDLAEQDHGQLYAVSEAGTAGHKIELRMTAPQHRASVEEAVGICFTEQGEFA